MKKSSAFGFFLTGEKRTAKPKENGMRNGSVTRKCIICVCWKRRVIMEKRNALNTKWQKQ